MKALFLLALLNSFFVFSSNMALAEEVVAIKVSSPQKSLSEEENPACFALAAAAEKVAVSLEKQVLPKKEAAIMDQDAVYRVVRTAGGTVCRVLLNLGANDMAWSFGAPRLPACECETTVDVK